MPSVFCFFSFNYQVEIMEQNIYMIRMQKILFIAKELHERGYENLRVIPSLSPSGMSWRCSFRSKNNREKEDILASVWIQSFKNAEENDGETVENLSTIFEKAHASFLRKCKGEDPEYKAWFRQMLAALDKGELPYAFSDSFGPAEYWKTSADHKIYTLPGEEQYYF